MQSKNQSKLGSIAPVKTENGSRYAVRNTAPTRAAESVSHRDRTAVSAAMSAVSHARGRVGIGVMHTAMQNNPQAIRTMSAIMLLGRLEIMPLLVLLMPSVWRRK